MDILTLDIPEQGDPPQLGNKTMKKLDFGKVFPKSPKTADPLWNKLGGMPVNIFESI